MVSCRWSTGLVGVVAAALLAASATPAHAVNYQTVPVGNAGNAPDTASMAPDYSTGYGSVSYDYRIGTYDVTIGQYCEFLNAVGKSDPNNLWDSNMEFDLNMAGIARAGSPGNYAYTVIGPAGPSQPPGATSPGNRPISYITWFSAARFANWLSNGQPVGLQGPTTTEDGAYTITGTLTAPARNLVNPNTGATPTSWIPTENEWYKAAYYSPLLNSGSGGYFLYATQSDDTPKNLLSGTATNVANYYSWPGFSVTPSSGVVSGTQNYLSDVGAFASSGSPYGTFDQSGLIFQWTDGTGGSGAVRRLRGGNWTDQNRLNISSRFFIEAAPAAHSTPAYHFGFRLAGPASPPVITIAVASGTQTQAQAGYALLSGTTAVVKTGAGTLVLDQANTLSGSLTVQGGRVSLANGSALGSSRLVVVAGGTAELAPYLSTAVAGLDLTGTGLVDVRNGSITVAGGLSPASLVASLLEGRNGGTWDGTAGITSSVTASAVAASELRAVGWLDNGDGSLTAAYAAPGDTNLDWIVDILDASNLVASGKYNTPEPATWQDGDFNYDGTVDVTDLADFVATGLYGSPGYNSPAGAVAAVPEPVSLAWLAAAAVAVAGVRGVRRGRAG